MTGSAAGAPDSSAARKVADALGDRYKVISKLGVGAFGEVYRARDTILERAVAIKRIRLNACDDPEGLDELKQRFMREAQVAAQLQHPNIVTVYDIVSTPDMTCIVMELLDGTSLKWMLASKKRLDLPRAIDILSQVAEALDYAHQQKVVHRDVKPANIMITASGQVKVTDFGIAKIESSTNLTASGSIVGTPNYMSPEQARGEDVDGRSDLFSLGCVLYECLAGQKPFRSSNLTGVLMGIVYDEPSPIDWEKVGLPAAVQRVVRGALAKDPAQRFASGAELVQALRSIPSADRAAEKGRLEKTLVDLAPVQETRGQGSVEETADRTSDSVADVLMISARRTKRIKRYLKALLKEERRLRAVSSPLLLFRNVSLTSDEAFVLSRIDGHHPPRYIFSLSPLSDTQTARTLVGLLRAGIIELEEEPEPAEAQATEEPASSDEAVRQEIEQLFELCQQQDHWQVLGLERDAGLEEIKRAFHEKVFRYHPHGRSR
jgi:serine/threonine protein kinase